MFESDPRLDYSHKCCQSSLCFSLCFVLDTFTDTAISSTRVNGEHKEKVLQRWEGGDSNGESYDLENDAVSCPLTDTETPTNIIKEMPFDFRHGLIIMQ